MNLTASSRVFSCPNTDLIAEVAEDIFCFSCSSIMALTQFDKDIFVGELAFQD